MSSVKDITSFKLLATTTKTSHHWGQQFKICFSKHYCCLSCRESKNNSCTWPGECEICNASTPTQLKKLPNKRPYKRPKHAIERIFQEDQNLDLSTDLFWKWVRATWWLVHKTPPLNSQPLSGCGCDILVGLHFGDFLNLTVNRAGSKVILSTWNQSQVVAMKYE